MAYKFQEGPAKLDGAISGSSTIIAKSSISSSGDIAVTGAAHAAQFYGGGANLTGISADAIDVTASTGDINYPIVFTQGAQSNGSLGLGLNTALNYNPSDGIVSSSAKAQFVGNSIFGGTLGVSGAMTIAGISGSGHAEFVTGVRTAGGLEVSGATTLAAGVSSSADARFVGNVESSGQIEASGSVLGSEFKTNDVTYGDSGITMDTDGGNLLFINNDADQQIYLKVGSDTAATSVTFINASSNALFAVDGTGQMQAAAISGSGVLQAVGATLLGSTLAVSGALTVKGTGSMSDINMSGALSGSSTLEVVGTVKSIGAMASSGSITAGSSFIIGSADLNETDMEKLDGITNGAGAANKALVLDANADVASGLRSVTASADLRAANVHATQFYGGGAGITGISSDVVDVSASVGGSRVYGIVGTQGAQTDGTLGLITTVSGASFNPLDAAWGSKLLLSGNVGGLQASHLHFGEKAGIGVIDDDGLIFAITSSETGIDISGSQDGGIAIFGGDGEEAGVGIYNSLFAVWNSDEDDMYKFAVQSSNGAVSGAAGAQFVGATLLGSTLKVSGAVTHASTTTLSGKLSSSAAMEIVGQVDVVGTLNVTGSSVLNGGIDVNGSNFTVSTAGAVSASSTLQVVGATTMGSNLGVTGAVSLNANGGGINWDGGTNTMKITNNGGNTFGFGSPGMFAFNNLISGSGALQIVGNGMIGGDLDVSGNLAVGDSTSDTMQVKATAVFAGPLGYKVGTITANSELTASTSRSYQIVSGGTSALTVTMPSASNTNYTYMIKRHSLMSGNVVITGSGGDAATQLIDGNASITLETVGASVFLISDGAQWNIF